MTFFFDNHHSQEIVEILRKDGVDAVHLREVFSDQGTDDIIWIPEIARRGWILVTADLRIRTRKVEKVVFQRARLITFFLDKGYTNKAAQNQIRWICDQWKAMETATATAEPGDCFLVPNKGRIRRIEEK